jgi:hypothetical protein
MTRPAIRISRNWHRVGDPYTVSEDEAAAILDKSSRTLRRWRKIGYGPPFIMDGKWVWYHEAGLHAWKAQHRHRRTPSDVLARAATISAASAY